MQALYQLDVRGQEAIGGLDSFFAESDDDDEVCRDLAKKWCMGTWENVGQCDKLIEESTMRWSLSRLSLVDKSILRLAVYQMRFCDDIPPKVAINEAIELAKKYSGDKSPAFINGVLDAVLKKITEKEQRNPQITQIDTD